jgi:hypothetical protein
MARGIEELAEMQVTGPVQGGDMVAKPNEMPVGAAALLNKMQKKSTPGIFKLPTPDKEMPDFMKVAAEGVEEETQMASGDTYNIMAGELLREGFNSDYIKSLDPITLHQLYEETFGSVTDDMSQVDPTDWRTILKMIESGMTPEQIEEQLAAAQFPGNFTQNKQDVKTIPTNLKTGPDNPETSLAYVTDEEKALLAFLNPGTPHKGPEDIPTYDEGDYLEDIGYSRQEVQRQQERAPTIDTSTREGQDKRQEFRDRTGSDVVTDAELAGRGIERGSKEFEELIAAPSGGIDTIIKAGTGGGDNTVQNMIDQINNLATSGVSGAEKIIKGMLGDAKSMFGDGSDALKSIYSGTKNTLNKLFGGGDDKEETTEDSETRENKQFQTFLKNILTPGGVLGGIGKSFGTLKMTPEKLLDPNYLAIMKDKLTGSPAELKKFKEKYGDIIASAYGPRGGTEAFETALTEAVAPEGSEAQRRTAPWEYYDQKRLAAVGGNPEKIASITITEDMKKNNPDFVDKIFAAREQVGRDRDRDQGGRGGGGRGTSEIIEDVAEVTTTDPRAGAFGVGGTMPYTHDTRTAGAQMDVPLGRRFEIDKAGKFRGGTGMSADEAYKYATLGGYSQLEPFQEYLARRRKHLGEEKPRYFDEEGNVIFSDMETT